MPAILQSIATATPPACTQRRAAEIAALRTCFTPSQESWMTTRFERAGIETRGSVLLADDECTAPYEAFFPPATGDTDRGPTTAERMRRYADAAPPLAERAAAAALERANVPASEITHLVTVSCTGFMAPGLDTLLIRRCGLPPETRRAHLGFMGCHGALNGLRVAEAFAATDSRAHVLVCAVELSSLHLHYGHDREKIVANALFADGAAAFVLGGGGDGWPLTDTASCVLEDSLDAMTWTIGDHGFEMGLAQSVPFRIQIALRPWLESWLAGHDLTIEDVRSWAVHPGGPHIFDIVERSLTLARGATAMSRDVLAKHGNMSSATLGFILERMVHDDAPRPCVALGFGPGLVAEGALFR